MQKNICTIALLQYYIRFYYPSTGDAPLPRGTGSRLSMCCQYFRYDMSISLSLSLPSFFRELAMSIKPFSRQFILWIINLGSIPGSVKIFRSLFGNRSNIRVHYRERAIGGMIAQISIHLFKGDISPRIEKRKIIETLGEGGHLVGLV